MPAMIVLGDKTDHGGEVIEASGVTDTHGKRIARVGDKVQCPKKGHGSTVIVSGDLTMVIDGKAVAYHGCKTSCGAMLISSQAVSTVDFGGGGGGGARSKVAAAEQSHQEFDEQIRALDQATGQPIADLSYLPTAYASGSIPLPLKTCRFGLAPRPRSGLRTDGHHRSNQ